MRSLYSALRLLPAYKIVRGLKKNKMATGSFTYKLGQPEFNSAPFPKGMVLIVLSIKFHKRTTTTEVAGEFRFGVIDTPFGQLSMSVEYKKEPGVKVCTVLANI